MFQFIMTVNSLRAEFIASGTRYDLPEGTRQIAVDKDGEVWAYESGQASILDGNSGWSDKCYDGFAVKVGSIPSDHLDNDGVFLAWRESSCVPVVPAIKIEPEASEAPVEPVKLNGRQLRGRVTEILDYEVKLGKPGSYRARTLLRDLSSVNFDFTDYSTVSLVVAMVELGFDLRLYRDMSALKAIDGAVTLALANE